MRDLNIGVRAAGILQVKKYVYGRSSAIYGRFNASYSILIKLFSLIKS